MTTWSPSEPVSDEDVICLVITIAARDFSAPTRRCGAVMREAERRGLIRRNASLCADGTERRFPVSLTPAGERMAKREGLISP